MQIWSDEPVGDVPMPDLGLLRLEWPHIYRLGEAPFLRRDIYPGAIRDVDGALLRVAIGNVYSAGEPHTVESVWTTAPRFIQGTGSGLEQLLQQHSAHVIRNERLAFASPFDDEGTGELALRNTTVQADGVPHDALVIRGRGVTAYGMTINDRLVTAVLLSRWEPRQLELFSA